MKNVVSLIIIFIIVLIGMNSFAANVDMNVIPNSTNGLSITTSSESRTNATTMKSVNELNTNTSNSVFGISQILDILLIAIGFIIILLAVAILIRLR